MMDKIRLVMLLAFLLVFTGGCESLRNVSISNRYVVAYVPDAPPFRPTTRFSDNGINWSQPIEVQDLGVPATSPQGIPVGIGAKPDQYMVAWFDSGVLRTAISSDATFWSHPASHGRHSVDARSRPAVEWNFNTDTWLVAFKTTSNQIKIVDANGPRAESMFVPRITTGSPPGLVWDADNRLHLIFADTNGKLRFVTSTNGVDWSPDDGNLVTASPGGGAIAQGNFSVSRSISNVALAISELHRPGEVSRAVAVIYGYRGGILNLESVISRSFPDSAGPVAIGPDDARSVIDAGSVGTTLWHDGTEVGGFSIPRVRVVSAAYGPSIDKELPQFRCGPCNKCLQSGGVNATNYRRTCVTDTGIPSDYDCLVCGFCENITGFVGPHRSCNPTQFGSDAPGQPDAEPRIEQCGLCQ